MFWAQEQKILKYFDEGRRNSNIQRYFEIQQLGTLMDFGGGKRRQTNTNWELAALYVALYVTLYVALCGLYVALCGDLVEGKSQLGVSCLMSSSPLGVLANLWALLVLVHHHLYIYALEHILFLCECRN